MSQHVNRRHFLTGVASGCLLPLLEAAPVAAQAAPSAPRRLVLLFNPNGTIPEAFWPQSADDESTFELAPILQPLEPFRERLLLLRGLDLKSTTKGPGGPHQRGMGALFTGRELQSGTMMGGDGSLAGWANGMSVDQEMVRRLAPPTLLPSLELGVRATAPEVRGRMIYSGPGSPVPPLSDPAEVFQRLSNGFRSGLDGAGDEVERAKRRMLLTHVLRQYDDLKPRVSMADREKLERHADFVGGIVRRLEFSINDSPACTEPTDPGAMEFDSETLMPDVAKLQLDLLALALSCDITRIASVQFSTAINAVRFPWLNSLADGHALSHRGPSDLGARDEIIARSRWYAERVAYLLERLAATPEGEGSVLDNTLIVWGNELSVGNVHSLDDIPFLLAGNLAGQLDTGRYLQFDHQPHNRLLVSLMQLMGVETDAFGDPDFTTAGALSGLTR